jgi:glycine cleavage system H protein
LSVVGSRLSVVGFWISVIDCFAIQSTAEKQKPTTGYRLPATGYRQPIEETRMGNYPENLYYTKDHEWIRVDGENGTVGITDFAQEQLGDVVHVQLPRIGEKFEAHDTFGEVESVKTFSELYVPVSGQVIEVNDRLADAPELVNSSPYNEGWMIKVKMSNSGEVDSLLSASEYEDFLESQNEE